MKLKIKLVAMLVAHTAISFLSLAIAAASFMAVLRPALGEYRYARFAYSSAMLFLLALVVGIHGFVLFRRWQDKTAFYAWVLPSIVALHLLLTRGLPSVTGFKGAVPLFEDSAWELVLILLVCGIAYSAGALLANAAVKKPAVTLSER